jgi:hypothetical protein
MPRISAYRGTYTPNRRPYVTMAPDAYVMVQGQTETIACGECKRKIDLNRYVTGINSEANVESPPGTATINLSIPDNDVNEFYVEGQFILISMMEIEVYSKGYYTVGGYPQYYRTFWGLINNISRSWDNGITSVTISCRDILRWWELTNTIVNPAFLETSKSSSGYNLFQNQYAGMNPYTVIMSLAKEAMGDLSLTTGSFLSFIPENGPEAPVVGTFAKDIMAYWQLKFGNIWNNLVLFGTSGQSYTFNGDGGNVSPLKISKLIFEEEFNQLSLNPETAEFKIQANEVAAFKKEIPRAGEVDFFQSEIQSKLSVAMTCRDQAGGYEFYCDTTGDIIFKPPFYNLNVMPNKPVSWIQDFEIINDSVTESEQDVFTHITASGNAFGGVTDWGLNSDITTPRTGVVDWHLLKRYGWRTHQAQVQWAGNPKKLFFHLLDYLDRINAKRESGTITVPYRPEIRMGFPVWIPKYDSFFYIQGISHQYSPGGQATTTLTLIAKRSKFIAPKNIGIIKKTLNSGKDSQQRTVTFSNPVTGKKESLDSPAFSIEFPSDAGVNSGVATIEGQTAEFGGPAILRNSRGKMVGFPNVMMVYKTTLEDLNVKLALQKSGSTKSNKPKKQQRQSTQGTDLSYDKLQGEIFSLLQSSKRADTIDRLRLHRYETGFTNIGIHDYAHDVDGYFKEFSIIPSDTIDWGAGTTDPNKGTVVAPISGTDGNSDLDKQRQKAASDYKQITAELDAKIVVAKQELNAAIQARISVEKAFRENATAKTRTDNTLDAQDQQTQQRLSEVRSAEQVKKDNLTQLEVQRASTQVRVTGLRRKQSVNVMARPVSDEFGFEVIGHYRYGRGAFVDKGQLQVTEQNAVTSMRLGIQFAAEGGIITDNPVQQNLGQDSTYFAKLYETMAPDDFVTGATFKGANYAGSNLADVNFTSQNTYENSINQAVTRSSKAVFIEADAIKRAKTLEELHPTSESGLDAVGFTDCTCGLGRAEWLSILPQEVLNQILQPLTANQGSPLKFADSDQSRFGSTGVGTTIGPKLQASLQAASNGRVELVTVNDFFNPDATVLVLGADQVNVEQQRAADLSSVINSALNASAQGQDINIDTPQNRDMFSLAGMDFDEFNAYAADSSKRVSNLGTTLSGSDSFSQGYGDVRSDISFSPETSGGFFDILANFLQQKFATVYEDANAKREAYARNAGRNVSAPNEGVTGSNILQGSDVFSGEINTLFDRASRGDADAIAALGNEANFNFGLTKKGLSKFKDNVQTGDDVATQQNFAKTKQPFTPIRPSIGDLINPSSVPGNDADRLQNVSS